MTALGSTPQAVSDTVEYLKKHLCRFIRAHERVLICFPIEQENSLGMLMERSVRELGAQPVIWGPDFRWKTLLRLAFSSKARVIIGSPVALLGLSKLSKVTGTPLSVRNVVVAGYPSKEWMIDGIKKGLDCEVWGCYDLNMGPVVCGFSCKHSSGVHLRSDVYTAHVRDLSGDPVPEGEKGEVFLSCVEEPEMEYDTMERGRLVHSACACGDASPRLMDLELGRNADPVLAELGGMFQSWTSILDCNVIRGESGLEMELVVFPGEKLPTLPSCAKLIVRPWDPEKDVPIDIMLRRKNPMIYSENH
jgi:phenylacetate-coenzyme A ligase PaaK-like adenylate-forming protein